jgi:UPF0716 family protein affecting phage T7 exclusion
VLIGGVLLITPGVLTDFVGLSLIAPWTRRALAPALKQAVMSRMVGGGEAGGIKVNFGTPRHAVPPRDAGGSSSGSGSGSGSSGGSGSPFDHPVL